MFNIQRLVDAICLLRLDLNDAVFREAISHDLNVVYDNGFKDGYGAGVEGTFKYILDPAPDEEE